MTDKTTSSATPPKVSLPDQDPFPESKWGPRRFYSFLFLVLCAVIGVIQAMRGGNLWPMSVAMIFGAICYMIAPSAEQLLRGLTLAWTLAKGVTIKSFASAEASGDGVTATQSTSATPTDPKGDPNE